MKRFVVIIVSVGALVAPTDAVAWHSWRLGSVVASQEVGRAVDVQCADSYAEWSYGVGVAGVALLGRDVVQLAPAACQLDSGVPRLAGNAALVLGHESMHLALDSVDEGLVECAARANLPTTLRLLGLRGARLNRAYRSAVAITDDDSGAYDWHGRC